MSTPTLRSSRYFLHSMSAFEFGAVELGAVQEGAVQVSAAQVGSIEVGVSEIRPVEVGVLKIGMAQVGAAEISTSEHRTAQVGPDLRMLRPPLFPFLEPTQKKPTVGLVQVLRESGFRTPKRRRDLPPR